VKGDTVSKYGSGAWAKSDPKDAPVARTGVVVGVNTAERLNDDLTNKAKEDVKTAVGAVLATEPHNLSVGAVGFTWKPEWKHVDHPDAGFAGAKAAFGKLLPGEGAKVKADSGGEMKTGGQLPYGIFREEVLGSSQTTNMVEHISQSGDPVHIVSQDADGQVGVKGGKGVLTGYDEFLRGAKTDPLLTIGGYNFGLDWSDTAQPHAAQLTALANEIDRAIRAAIAGIYPEMLYPAEPNSLIKAHGKDGSGILDNPVLDAKLKPVRDNETVGKPQEREGKIYGIGATEGVVARNNIGAATPGGLEGKVAAPPDLSISTSAEPNDPKRALTRTEQDVHDAEAGTLIQGHGKDAQAIVPEDRRVQPGEAVQHARQHQFSAVSTQSQSTADPRTLAREFRKGTPALFDQEDHGKGNSAALNQTFQSVEAAGRALVGNPSLAQDSAVIEALKAAAAKRAGMEAEQDKHSAEAPLLRRARSLRGSSQRSRLPS